MKKIYRLFLGIVLILCLCNTTNAQIKIVGKDFTIDDTTGRKNYFEKDVDFEKLFPIVTKDDFPVLPYSTSYMGELNLIGDTLFFTRDYIINMSTDVEKSWDFCVNNLGVAVSDTMKTGYYEVIGYVYFAENVDSVRNAYGIPFTRPFTDADIEESLEEIERYGKDLIALYHDENYEELGKRLIAGGFYRPRAYLLRKEYEKLRAKGGTHYANKRIKKSPFYRDREIEDISRMEDEFSEYGVLTKDFKFEILKGEPVYSLPLEYIVLHSVDTSDNRIFYLRIKDLIKKQEHIVNTRFYNEALSLLGKEVCLFRRKSSEWRDWINTLYDDPLTDITFKIQDESFMLKDIVFNGSRFFVIVEGIKTGTFAVGIDYIHYVNDVDEIGGTNGKYRRKDGTKGDIAYFGKGYDYKENIVIAVSDCNELTRRKKVEKISEEKERERIKTERQKEQLKRENEFKQKIISKYPPQFAEIILKKQISIGMTKEMCKDAWGKPMNTYRTTTEYGQSEVWCYGYKTMLYFNNNKLVKIED